MKVWVTALMPTKGADVYEGIRTGAALSEREAYLELLDFFDTADDVELDQTATNEQIIDLLNSHPEVNFWKIESQEVTTHRVGDLRNKIVEILIGANAAKTLEGVIADEILELVGPTFVLNQEQWDALHAALDAPSRDVPKLKKLLAASEPGPHKVRVDWDVMDMLQPNEFTFQTKAEADAFRLAFQELEKSGTHEFTVDPKDDYDEDDDDGQGFPIHTTADDVIAGAKCGVCEKGIVKGERVIETAPGVFHHEQDCLTLAPVVDEDGEAGRIQIYLSDWHIKSLDNGEVIASVQMEVKAASEKDAIKAIDAQIRDTRPEADLDDITVVVDPPEVVDEDDEEEDDEDLDTCTTPGCGNSTADGEGWDGKCGSCADKDFAEEPGR
jgi:hypothetical protein